MNGFILFFAFLFSVFSPAVSIHVTEQQEKYRLKVRASDKGEPQTYADVDVELDVVDRNNKPPIWDIGVYGPTHIKENVTVGTVVTSVKARLV